MNVFSFVIQVEFAEAEAMCEYIPEILFVMETSAKENANVDDAFICLATELKVSSACKMIMRLVLISTW